MAGGPQEVFHRARNFVPREGFFLSRVDPAGAHLSVRRIENRHIKGSRLNEIVCIPGIAAEHLHPALQAVQRSAPSGHAGQTLLDFDARDPDGWIAKCQDKAYHAAAGAEFKKALFLSDFYEMGQQDGVDRVSVALLLLEDLQPPPEEGLDGLIVMDQRGGSIHQIISVCLVCLVYWV
jgi:hypothetical protein